MTKLETINHEINKLESIEHLTYDICQKLAILYIVREHLAIVENDKPVISTLTNSLEITK